MDNIKILVVILMVVALTTSIAAALVSFSPAVKSSTGATLEIASGNNPTETNTQDYMNIAAKNRRKHMSDINVNIETKHKPKRY